MHVPRRSPLLFVALAAALSVGYLALPSSNAAASKARTSERAAAPSVASGDPIYMNMKPTIVGGVTTPAFNGWIELTSMAWPSGCSSGSGSQIVIGEVNVTTLADASYPKVFGALATNEVIPSVTIEYLASSTATAPYLTYRFTNVYVTNVATSAAADRPSESISFTFGTYKISDSGASYAGVNTYLGLCGPPAG
jgi:type VI protein secretion system component Hcp